MAQHPGPPSRRDRQQQTRHALVSAAREAFAEEGFHRANLEQIAHRAGYSKGAVYSNFEGKAALFLAVLDANLSTAEGEGWDPFEGPGAREVHAGAEGLSDQEMEQLTTGFALATLEFVAVAARDQELAADLRARMRTLLDAYITVARRERATSDELSAEQTGALLAALSQGAGFLQLAAETVLDRPLLQEGMRRIIGAGPDGAAQQDRG